MANYWILKSEPSTYSFEDLRKDKKTPWDGVRNYQARNYLNEVKKGDLALIYHSGSDKAVVGISKCIKKAYPDPDPKKKGDWVQIEIGFEKPLKTPVTLKTIKETPALKNLPLIRHTRLSVMPITKKEFDTLTKMGSK